MQYKEAIRKINNGFIIIEYDNKDLELLKKLLKEAFPEDEVEPEGLEKYYMIYKNEWWIGRSKIPNEFKGEVIKLSEIEIQ